MVLAPPAGMVSNREEDSMNTEASMSGKTVIGLIYPPPDIRTIVDKTASFVARNGTEFENKIREKEANNSRFNFLSSTDPYHAYYKFKVREFQEGKADPLAAARPQLPEAVKEAVKKAEFVPQKPPPAFEFSADPATINAYDLDLIRLTAIFVARNGRQFLTQLMTREARNYQFDFLKPAHSNFTYFTKLVEQYTKVIIPSNNIVSELKEQKGDTNKLLEDVKYRVAWEKHQRGLKEKEEREAEKERQAYASIDWHDFVVVQTVDFQPGDTSNLPALCTPQDVGARILMEARNENAKATSEAVEMDMEESGSEDEAEEIEHEVEQDIPQPEQFQAPLPPSKQKDIIVRDYDPKKGPQKKGADQWLISPLTGEKIPMNKMDEHVRYNTVDSQYKEDRDRQMGVRTDEPVIAQGSEISRSLAWFAERRTDIFGAGAEQTAIGRKFGEEEPRPTQKLIWDGTEETRDAVTRAMQSQVTLDQQIHEIHRQHGFVSDPSKERIGAQPQSSGSGPAGQKRPMPPPEAMPPAMPPSMPNVAPPPAKKQKTEDDLVPEAEWLQRVNGSIDLRVQLPLASEFNLNGNIMKLDVNINESVANLKQLIQDQTQLPASKQKLTFDGFFLKDNLSLAFYNMANMSFVVVSLKERGGKNK